MSKLSIAETLEQHKAGTLDVEDLWWDWFCKDSSLKRKGNDLLRRLRMISNSPKFDPKKTYVFFKNNWPCSGTLYDDFRICDLVTGDVIFTVIPRSGFYHNFGAAEIWGHNKEGKFCQLFEGSWKDAKAWFMAQ